MTKQELRQEIRLRKAACPAEERAALSREVNAALADAPQWKAAHTVLLYHALPDEVDTLALIRQAADKGKRVLLPVVVDNDLELREYRGERCLAEGAFHILEPQGAPFTDYAAINLAVIPGVAFTRDGHRLGRGRGYYDRLLPRLRGTYKLGLCWPFQLVDEIPTEPHDILMDRVITT
mgnify:CR=1 FL=1